MLQRVYTPLELRVDEVRNQQDVRAFLAHIASQHVAKTISIADLEIAAEAKFPGTNIRGKLGVLERPMQLSLVDQGAWFTTSITTYTLLFSLASVTFGVGAFTFVLGMPAAIFFYLLFYKPFKKVFCWKGLFFNSNFIDFIDLLMLATSLSKSALVALPSISLVFLNLTNDLLTKSLKDESFNT